MARWLAFSLWNKHPPWSCNQSIVVFCDWQVGELGSWGSFDGDTDSSDRCRNSDLVDPSDALIIKGSFQASLENKQDSQMHRPSCTAVVDLITHVIYLDTDFSIINRDCPQTLIWSCSGNARCHVKRNQASRIYLASNTELPAATATVVATNAVAAVYSGYIHTNFPSELKIAKGCLAGLDPPYIENWTGATKVPEQYQLWTCQVRRGNEGCTSTEALKGSKLYQAGVKEPNNGKRRCTRSYDNRDV